MKVLVIGNPIAGGGKAARKIDALAGLLRARGHAAEVFLTAAAGDARARAAALEGDTDALVAVGGDGTLNEVLNGLPEPFGTPIAFLSAGTANVTARELGLDGTPEEIVRLIDAGAVRRIDVGRAGTRRFLMLASVGFDALVIEEDVRRRRKAHRFMRFAVPIVRALWRYRAPALSVTVDDAPPVGGTLAIVSKTPHYGGFFNLARGARCDSGVFEVTVCAHGSRGALVLYALAALCGCMGRLGSVTTLHGTRVAVESREPAWVEVDGESFGMTPVTFELAVGALPFLAPPFRA